MKQQVLTFYTKLLGRIRQPLLPHINVHRPVQVKVSHVLLASIYNFTIKGLSSDVLWTIGGFSFKVKCS